MNDEYFEHDSQNKQYQKIYFSASCTILGSRELRISPNTAPLRAVSGFPGLKDAYQLHNMRSVSSVNNSGDAARR